MDQQLNLTNSKLKRKSLMVFVFIGAISVCAVAIGLAAMGFNPPLTGRLHPALVPLLLVGVLLMGLLLILFSGTPSMASTDEYGCPPAEPVDRSSLVAAVLSVMIFALCARPFGVVLTLWVATAVAAYGIRGVLLHRALLIGAVLSGGFSALFIGILRQPLPLWPQSFLQ